jgi:lysophospholipase L1-like esterase
MRQVALALASTVLFLGALELAVRALGLGAQPEVAHYIANWERQWDGEFYIFEPRPGVNRDGVRDIDHELERRPGVARVAFLGDSVTFGYRLPAWAAYPALLREELEERGERVEVMNVALPGWSTRQQRIAYQRIVRKYRPDQVIVGFCLNDVAEAQNNLARPPALIATLYRLSALVRTLLAARSWEIRNVEQLFFERGSRKVEEGWERALAELSALADAVEADGARFALLVFPFRFQLDPDAPPPDPQERLRSWAQARGAAFLDVLPTLRRVGRPGFVDYDHLSHAGATVVARELAQSGLLDAEPLD